MATTRPITEEELLALPEGEHLYELVDGEVRISPRPTLGHSRVTMRLLLRLGAFVQAHGLGLVLPPDTGFRMSGGNIRSPDLSFIARERVPVPSDTVRFPEAPDLAVEVLSPHDHEHPREFMDKIGEYIASGVRLIWVIDLRTRHTRVYRALDDVRVVPADGVLDGEDVVPGFSCPLATIFE